MPCLQQLPDSVRERFITSLHLDNVLFWIGSGFSRNFGYSSWGEVLAGVAAEIGYAGPLDADRPLRSAELLLSHALMNGKTEFEFNGIVASVLKSQRKTIPEPAWAGMFRNLCPQSLVTTNWDHVLEEILEFLPNVVVRGDLSPQISRNRRNILKIHGNVEQPGSIVVTQSQYNRFQREDTYLSRKVYTLFTEMMPVFIGYSLTDPNIFYLYEEALADFGINKSPGVMVVRPSTVAGADAALAETRLLFHTKDVHLVVAEIGEFLQACQDELAAFRAGNEAFWHDYKDVKRQLTALTLEITNKKSVPPGTLEGLFPGKDAAARAIRAITKMVASPTLYAKIGGSVLSPSNQLPLDTAQTLFQQAIALGNKHGWTPEDISQFDAAVVRHCTTSDGIWDFTTAKTPFLDILAIHPAPGTQTFTDKIEHVRRVLNWSDNKYKGYCWATWNLYLEKIQDAIWITEADREGLIASVEATKLKDGYVGTDEKRWLSVMRDDANTSAPLKVRVEALLA